ncbi:MAG TPA: sulfotransferase family protein [Rhizobiaceae bacterium]
MRIARRLNSTRSELYLRSVHLPRLRAIYLTTPKVAGSTIMATLVKADGSQRFDGITNYNDRAARHLLSSEGDPRAFWHDLGHPDCFRFSFVRNPYDRIISAYLDKIALGTKPRKRKLPGLGPVGEISFRDFLLTLQRQKAARMNRHWRPQSLLISPRVKLDFLGRFERFETDFAHVLERLGVEPAAITNRRGHKTSAAEHRDMIGPEEKALIDSIYGEDFERFDYTKSLQAG